MCVNKSYLKQNVDPWSRSKLSALCTMVSPDCLVSGEMLEIADWVPDDILSLSSGSGSEQSPRSGVRSPVTLASHWSGVIIPALSWAVQSKTPGTGNPRFQLLPNFPQCLESFETCECCEFQPSPLLSAFT